jgi:GDP-L-fucose synthase
MKDYKIYISGHKGMVGSATVKIFKEAGYNYLVTASREDLDLTNVSLPKSFCVRV